MINLKPSRNFFSDLRDNQIAALWMLIGSRRCFDWVTPNGWQFVFWAILASSANTLFSWLTASGEGHFNSQGLISYLLWPFIALIAGIFMAQRSGLGRLMLVPAILWLVADVNIALLQSFIQFLGQIDRLPDWSYDFIPKLFLVLFVWQTVAVIWVFSRVMTWPWWERILILIGTIITLTVWQSSVSSQPIWKVEEQRLTLPEAAIYAQPRLLDDVLTQMQKGLSGESSWYFMGVAGAGYQDVFKSEVDRIQRQFDTRFGTYGRSIALVNNKNTFSSQPIATRVSIERALARIGQQMNPDSDVLFLYMTSHGLPNVFELANEPIDMQSVDPQWLRETLDRSGIRWRVIVISACYSGSFIPALQSPDTLIITASSADQASFGCSNEAEYTYFGRAFFDEAMRTEHGFKPVFDKAVEQISRWETAQGFPASKPQFKLGQNMELMLPQFENRLFPPDIMLQQANPQPVMSP
jgi:hypothetical protein